MMMGKKDKNPRNEIHRKKVGFIKGKEREEGPEGEH